MNENSKWTVQIPRWRGSSEKWHEVDTFSKSDRQLFEAFYGGGGYRFLCLLNIDAIKLKECRWNYKQLQIAAEEKQVEVRHLVMPDFYCQKICSKLYTWRIPQHHFLAPWNLEILVNGDGIKVVKKHLLGRSISKGGSAGLNIFTTNACFRNASEAFKILQS